MVGNRFVRTKFPDCTDWRTQYDWNNPNTIVRCLQDRQRRFNLLANDDRLLAAAVTYYKSDRRHYIDFIEDWMVTYDPRNLKLRSWPFILWKRQKDFIEWLIFHYENKENGLVEKARAEGATYLSLAFAICVWLFEDEMSIGFGSAKQEKLDRLGDPDTVFEKGRMIIQSLPFFFLPTKYEVHHMRFINQENGSTITGEVGDNIGRGGRKTIYFKDESGFYEHPEKIDAALSQTTNVQIDISTPNGAGNPFFQKRFSFNPRDIFIFDWHDNPTKGEEWYKEQKRKFPAFIVAQEIDRDYFASIENVCIPNAWVLSALNLDIPYSGRIESGLDVADEGGDDNCLTIRQGPKVQHMESWSEGNTTQTTRKAYHIAKSRNVELFKYDNIGVGAGVKGELSNPRYNIFHEGVSWSSSPTLGRTDGKKNKDAFLNLKAECYWKLRRRFEKTHEFVNGIVSHPYDDLISIPNDPLLVAELSVSKYTFTESGKIKIESKESLSKRGIRSPNRADSLAYSFAPVRSVRITF